MSSSPPTKNGAFVSRLGYAVHGLVHAWCHERSFRFQAVCGVLVWPLAFIVRPALVWWAVMGLAVGLVLAAELVNASIEALADRLHPERHESIMVVKDCAAAAVLVAAAVSVVVGSLAVASTGVLGT